MSLSRVATFLCVAVVAGATTAVLTNDDVTNAPLKVLGAGLIASGVIALLHKP